jgi:hypothetical protein
MNYNEYIYIYLFKYKIFYYYLFKYEFFYCYIIYYNLLKFKHLILNFKYLIFILIVILGCNQPGCEITIKGSK